MSSSRLQPLVLLFGAICCGAAAAPGDVLQVHAGLGFAHDDNLLRIPEGQPAFDNTRGDSWVVAEGALLFDKTWHRQRVAASARLSKVKFDHFNQLDYDGKDLQATWYWQLGKRFEGKAGATYAQVLAPYTDFRSDERNLRQQRRQFADGTWRLHPRWRVRGALMHDKYTYDLARQRFNDRTEDTFELEGGYQAGSGSAVGLVLRRIEGEYPNGRPRGPFIIADNFDQDELKARVHWIASGVTTVQALAGWARRQQPSLGEGPSSGFNGRVSAQFAPRGKLGYNAAAWRDFAPIESTLVSYTLNKGASVGAAWEPSARVKLDTTVAYERRVYNARREFVPGAGELRDSLRSANLRATYTLRPGMQLSAAFAHEARSGSVALGQGRFRANSISFNAGAQF
jgi:exopolysaccharide biosynthesis operon protein EpsL